LRRRIVTLLYTEMLIPDARGDVLRCTDSNHSGPELFCDPSAVRDHINEVRVFESETDKVALGLKMEIYGSDLSFERKTQLRDATNMLDKLADRAENLGDNLAIFAIKRAL